MAKGNFIEYVVSDDPNKYPNDGEQGDYYYEKVVNIETEEQIVTAGTTPIEVVPSTGKLISKVNINPTPTEEKTITAGTSATTVTPTSGKYIKKVTINPTPSQEKTIEDPSETTIIIPDEGKLLSKVTINIFNPSLVTWAGGTDEEIVKMVQLADEGKINLSDYWAVGDTRTVQLSAMSATGVGESHSAQKVDLVLMHAGGYELSDGSTCNFIVGQKHALPTYGYMNSSSTNLGSWDGCARRTWCNEVYKNAIPESLRSIFKQFKTITAETYNGTTLKTSLDYFALPAAKEIFGGTATSAGTSTSHSNLTEFNALFQFEWYKTPSNRNKKGINGYYAHWWERSPYYGNSNRFCRVFNDGTADIKVPTEALGLAPFGCI